MLDTYDEKKEKRIGSAAGTDFILRILNLFCVDELQKTIGRSVYALLDHDRNRAQIIGLEMPEFDGGEKFMIKDWQKEWK